MVMAQTGHLHRYILRTTGFPREQAQFITTEFGRISGIIGIIIRLIIWKIGLTKNMEAVEV